MTASQVLASTAKHATPDTATYSLLVAQDRADIAAAQRLRYAVFAGEMGATLHSLVPGRDADQFDARCDHLVVRHDPSGDIVGTYRMLPPEHASGGLYADTEFDLGALDALRPGLVETGRSCVHPDHRTGAVVSLVWQGIARYMLLSGHRYLGGCASVPLADGGSYAAGVWDVLRAKHYAPESLRVLPRRPWHDDVPRPDRAVVPPLLRGYLRLGAQVCGPPAHDPDFGVADFFVLLDLHELEERYIRYFLGV